MQRKHKPDTASSIAWQIRQKNKLRENISILQELNSRPEHQQWFSDWCSPIFIPMMRSEPQACVSRSLYSFYAQPSNFMLSREKLINEGFLAYVENHLISLEDLSNIYRQNRILISALRMKHIKNSILAGEITIDQLHRLDKQQLYKVMKLSEEKLKSHVEVFLSKLSESDQLTNKMRLHNDRGF